MKKLLVFLSPVLLLMLVSCSSSGQLTKSKQPHKVILSSLHVQLNNFDNDDFYSGDYGTLLLSLRDDAMENADLGEVHQVFNKKQNKDVKAELDTTFTVIKDSLKKYNWHLLPADYLKGKIAYDSYGYPEGGKTSYKLKKGETFLKVSMYLSANDLQTNYETPVDFEIIYQPRLGLDVKMIGSDGKTIWKRETFVNADQSIIIDENHVGGIQSLKIEQTPSLSGMVQQALKQMLKEKKS
ncbi:MAG TPA: hypothetical protein VKA34_22895 [Balneolales bacterium]|nr:hypothetical protein [Balneolales bacterium]